MDLSQRKIRARYKVVGPRTEKVNLVKCTMNEDKNLVMETVVEELQTYMVYFPQGHSIRILSKERLIELGFHLKPRMVDMETGDVIDIGGDPYDFGEGVDEVAMDIRPANKRRRETEIAE